MKLLERRSSMVSLDVREDTPHQGRLSRRSCPLDVLSAGDITGSQSCDPILDLVVSDSQPA